MSSGQRFQLSNLAPEYRRAGVIAVLLFATMFLPWYTVSTQARSKKTGDLSQHHETFRAFQSFSLVEAAILLVAISILALLFVRGQKRPFHLPGGDGLVIAAGGTWVCFLVAYRFVDNKQGNPSDILVTVDYGVTWGIFVTFLVGLLLVHTGLRIRAAHISEPPNPTATMPMARKAKPRPRAPLEVDEDTNWTEDEATQITSEGKAVDPLRYDDPV